MYDASLACNGIFSNGSGPQNWPMHGIEHALSGYYDITHGIGLAILTPSWMKYVLSDDTIGRFVMYANNVWDVSVPGDLYEAAREGIRRTEKFFTELGMPRRLCEIGIDGSLFGEMASEAVRTSSLSTRAYVKLDVSDVENIYNNSL